MSKADRKFATGDAKITVNYGYDIHSISCSGRTLRRILKGDAVTLRGQGFYWDGQPDQDRWSFNAAFPGSLTIYTEGGGTIFDGDLASGEVWASLDANDVVLELRHPDAKGDVA